MGIFAYPLVKYMAEKLKYYTRREEFLNAVSHISGVIFGIFAGFLLYRRAIAVDRTPFTIGIIFYWLSFMAMFAASSFYHLCRTESHKVFARKLDHCAIYLLITGTYAPLITGAVKTVGGYSVLAVLGVLYACGVRGNVLTVSVIGACAPVGATTTIFAAKFGHDTDLSVRLVSLSKWACSISEHLDSIPWVCFVPCM